jgi:D-beta-D-heptose 7-phosphate kinase/D-beta-D-heptose 1-phosphate adenosyltransferase
MMNNNSQYGGSNLELPALENCRILVVGEAVLDRYLWGETDRISPEAPIPVLHVRRYEHRPGNAAFVCASLAAIGATPVLLSVVGTDQAGKRLRKLMKDTGVDVGPLVEDARRPTILKERFMGSVQSAQRATQQLLRVDHEDTSPVGGAIERRLQQCLAKELDRIDGVLICDIGKGVLAPGLLRSVIDGARSRRKPVIADPRRADEYSIYRGATALTPNRYETERATGLSLTTPESWGLAARTLIDRCELTACLITLDRDGVFVAEGKNYAAHVPTNPREVYDVTGAGDVVLAIFGAALIKDVDLTRAARIANLAAGLEVTKQGATVISPSELTLALYESGLGKARKVLPRELLLAHLLRQQKAGRRICFVYGTFSPLRTSHIDLFERGRENADLVVVGLETPEASCRSDLQIEQARLLACLEPVDYVFAAGRDEIRRFIELVCPEVLLRELDSESERGRPQNKVTVFNTFDTQQ